MVFHLNELDLLHSPRKHRFPDRFLDDLSRLVNLSTTEIVSKVQKEGKDSKVRTVPLFIPFTYCYSYAEEAERNDLKYFLLILETKEVIEVKLTSLKVLDLF